MTSTSTVELYLSAKDLTDRDLLSKSDPFAVLSYKGGYTRPSRVEKCRRPHAFYSTENGSWVSLGNTERIKDCLNPVWAKQFVVDYFFEQQQVLKVEIYDKDENCAKLAHQDRIGKAKFTLGQVMGSPGQSATVVLKRKNALGNKVFQGAVQVRAEQVKACAEGLRLQLAATDLVNMDGMFSKSDP